MTPPAVFRLAYVPGVMPAKWVRVFIQRRPEVVVELVDCAAGEAADLVRSGVVDAALGRPGEEQESALSLIRLYDEVPVVVVPKDHVVTAADELTCDDLADESYFLPLDDVLDWATRPGIRLDHRPQTTAEAVELVAAGLGVLVVPMSLARLHHRRDLTYRPLVDAPTAPVGLWWSEPTGELVDEFIGVGRGRTPGSSRGQREPVAKRSAKEKAAARRERLEAAGKVPPPRSRRAGQSKSRRSPGRGGR